MVFIDFRHELSLFLTTWPPAHNQFFCYDIFPFWRRITTNYGKFLKRWEYQTTIFLLRNLYAGQEATVRTEHGITVWFKIGKGVCQGCILSPCLFNMQSTCEMPGSLESRLPGEISATSDMQMILLLRQKVKEFQKNIYFCYIDYAKAFDCVDHNKLENC